MERSGDNLYQRLHTYMSENLQKWEYCIAGIENPVGKEMKKGWALYKLDFNSSMEVKKKELYYWTQQLKELENEYNTYKRVLQHYANAKLEEKYEVYKEWSNYINTKSKILYL